MPRILRHPLAVPALAAVLAAAVWWICGWHRFVPILSKWEAFQYFYTYATADPHLSFAIAPRANIGGQGYPLLDVGRMLTDALGLTLPTFRLASLFYGIATYGLMIVVFRRWFGLYPALTGTTLTILSTGYLFLTDQLLVFTPTVFLSVLLVERVQRLSGAVNNAFTQITVAAVIALLLVHYAMGRYFAVGWLAWFFFLRLAVSYREYPAADARWDSTKRCLCLGTKLVAATAALLFLLDAENLAYLADPVSIFFPDKWDEIETTPNKLLPTLINNTVLLAQMIVALPVVGGDQGLDPLLAGHRTQILNLWHLPFLLIGVAVSVRRTLRNPAADVMPYASLHVIAALTLGIPLFSEQIGEIATISTNRTIGGMVALAGYIVVGCQWIGERAHALPSAGRTIVLALPFMIGAGAIPVLNTETAAFAAQTRQKAEIVQETGQFAPLPETLPPGAQADTYLHARFARLAEFLKPLAACRPQDTTLLFRIYPGIFLRNGTYDGLHYFRDLNDLSSAMALYLADMKVNAAHIIVHSAHAKGHKERGHGYGGFPRVFSGPIAWRNGTIEYTGRPPYSFSLQAARPREFPTTIVAFSNTEADAAAQITRRHGKTLVSVDIRNLARPPANLPAACPDTAR